MSSMHRQVLILAVAQALFQSASVMVITVGGLAGAMIASDPVFATAPVASMFLGTASGTIPASLWMARAGRKLGFVAGAFAGIVGGFIAATGIWTGSLLILSAGTFFVGVYQAFAQFYRFAAAEVANTEFRSRAISLVLAGGVVAAIAGPLLAKYGQHLAEPSFIGSFILLAIVAMLAVVVLLMFSAPPQVLATHQSKKPRPLQKIIFQRQYLLALFCAATGYGIMILAMTATPIAMAHHDHSIGDTALVIQMHVLGMFLPSFFTGALISRFGVIQVMLAGVLLFIIHVLLTLTGTNFYSFLGALIFLGVGWNFLYVGGTTLLTTTYSTEEGGSAQGVNDLAIFIIGLSCSLAAGALLHSLGWQLLNLILLPWLALAAISLFVFRRGAI